MRIPRERVVAEALRLLEAEGADSLQARKLAASLDTSTMVVYTHFRGMGALIEELGRQGFLGLRDRLARVAAGGDAVADLFRLGLAYREQALGSPALYRLMFGLSAPAGHRLAGQDLITGRTPTTVAEGQAAFAHLVNAVGRVIDSGRIRPADPTIVAAQLWSLLHGYVLLEIGGFFGDQGRGAGEVLIEAGVNLVVGLGDRPEAAGESALRSLDAAGGAEALDRRPTGRDTV